MRTHSLVPTPKTTFIDLKVRLVLAIRKTDLCERNSSFSKIPLCNYWKVIPHFVPLNGLHADICVLQIGSVQAERVYIFVQWKFIWEKNVTSAYIEWEYGRVTAAIMRQEITDWQNSARFSCIHFKFFAHHIHKYMYLKS